MFVTLSDLENVLELRKTVSLWTEKLGLWVVSSDEQKPAYFRGFRVSEMIPKRKPSLSLLPTIMMLYTLPSRYQYVHVVKLTSLGGVNGRVLHKRPNLFNNKYLCPDFNNHMLVDRVEFYSKHRSFLHPLIISIRYFSAETLVIAARNKEKISVSVVFSTQQAGEEMPIPASSITALNVGRHYFRVWTRISSGSSAEHLLKSEELAKQSVLMMRRSSFGSTADICTGTQYPNTCKRVPELLRGSMPVKDKPGYSRSVQAKNGEYSRFVTGRVFQTGEACTGL